MNIEYAGQIIKSLADGVNPITGEILKSDDSCNQPDVIRALYTVLEHMDKSKSDLPENAGMPWTIADDERLCKMFDDGMTIKYMAGYFKRTDGAVKSRLEKLGKIKR